MTPRNPVILSRPAPEGLPASWSGWWRTPASALMESGRTGKETILIPELPEVWICRETGAERHTFTPGGPAEMETFATDPSETLENLLAKHGVRRLPDGPDFQGGVVALLSYDLARTFERLPNLAKDDLGAPQAVYAPVPGALVYDHERRTLHAVATAAPGGETQANEKCLRLLEEWDLRAKDAGRPALPAGCESATGANPKMTLDETAFKSAVERIREYILAGDTYQVNLSTRLTLPLHASPENVYETLRKVNPSPYMGLFRMPGFTLVCGSPELLVRARRGTVESRPIAGTRPRGETAEHDAELRAELVANGKENAEHLMLVDLLRNDLGRVCEPGTVEVPEYATVEAYSHVMHLVSQVSGSLRAGTTASEIVRAVFPGGTITGAPKVRTMEIIEELEPVRRAFYTGSAGWISGPDAMELNILIRTLHAADGVAHIQAGAGVVADSSPEREFRESLNKASAQLISLNRTPHAPPR